MKLKSISFENYKVFAERQTLELKPITILIGKNSSGKSAVAKLFTLLENSLSGNIKEPLLLRNNGVEVGGEFKDLIFGRRPPYEITFALYFEDNVTIEVKISGRPNQYRVNIAKWCYSDSEDHIELLFSPDKGYTDAAGLEYECEFRGILPVKMKTKNGIDSQIPEKCERLKINVDYIGPFRVLPDREFRLTGEMDFEKTGIGGEKAYDMLSISKIMETDLHQKVSDWYKEHFDGWELNINDTDNSLFQIILSKAQKKIGTKYEEKLDVNIVDVGQGMHQVLPLVVRANVAKPDSIIILEQPELHLHPAAHGDLAELFAKSAKEFNQNYLIETHAENILLRLRRLIVENKFGFTKDDVIIYWIDEDEDDMASWKYLKEITITEEGILSDWPEGVFNENLAEIFSMRKAVEIKRRKKYDHQI